MKAYHLYESVYIFLKLQKALFYEVEIIYEFYKAL